MHHILFESCTQYQIAVLAKTDALRKDDISQWYVDPLVAAGIPQRNFIAFSLEYGTAKKPSVAYIKEYLQDELLPELKALGVKYLYCTDGNYFKVLTKQQKAEVHLGYVLPCAIPGYEHMQVILSMNYKAVFANDAVKDKIIRANAALVAHYTNTYTAPGTNIIHSAKYIESDATKIKAALEPLLLFPSLTADTETFSLRHTKAKLGTISFAWDEHNGIAIDILHKEATLGFPAWKTKHKAILEALRWFFETYEGTVIWHNATYDIKILVYLLYMENLTDTAGLLRGLEVMTRNFEDTKIIAYLATNTCSENPLDLKSLAQPFAGNYAQEDIKDIVLIPSAKLLEYNLIDCLSTWYVLNKYHPLMVSANQEGIYKTLFKPMLKQAIQMELTGMPINMANVIKADKELEQVVQTNYATLTQSTILQAFIYEMREQELIRRNAAYKKKVITIEDVKYEFNPNSNDQLGALLHEFLGFEVFTYTPTKKPVVGADELKGHLNRTSDPNVKILIQAIMDILEGVKIRNTFIAKFLEADEYDGWHYLFGGFNVGGTKSGRLSSSEPNLQNLPSGSTYGHLVKTCFQAPPGWLYVGIDFNALEDTINMLLTRDPNKLKIKLQGFDGHSYRCYHFWPEKFPQLNPEDPKSINSIKHIDDAARSNAKAPHFALQYLGTWATLVKNCGFSPDEAKSIEQRYKSIFATSYDWVDKQLQQASNDGYVTLAFGLRLRTPILQKTVLGSKFTPAQAAAESRTAGNAVSGQSYGLLNSRAGVEFQNVVLNSAHRLDVRPCAQIHDAQYFMVRNTLGIMKWVNDELVKCVQWQDLPEIQHPEVKLSGEVDIFYPTWAEKHTIPNHASYQELVEKCK